MNKYIESMLLNVQRIQQRREEIREEHRISIRNGTIKPIRSANKNNPLQVVFFGELIQFHHFDMKDNAEVRCGYQLWYRMLAEEAIHACKTLLAINEAGRCGEVVSTNSLKISLSEEQYIDKYVEVVDNLVFGKDHHMLLGYEDFQRQYPDCEAPFTTGCFVEIGVVYKVCDAGLKFKPFYNLARLIAEPDLRGDENCLKRETVESSLNYL